ncbi:conserved protein of unknown function [Nitratireductor aquimarinus]|uniref:hypothetical protein n=1 Tax=Nitratireductor aquimarinus TaxID=889300 RepID=UPI003B5A5669
MTAHIETSILQEPADINQRLAQLGLTREGLIRAVHVALTERNNATGLHPSNAAGTFSYHHGVAAIRREYLGGDWEIDRRDGIEAILNDTIGVKVSFCNVDEACGRDHPKPRSEKGAGAERASGPNLFDYAGAGDLTPYAPKPVDGKALFYLMVDQHGRAELTRPVVARRTFVAAVERIFLIDNVEEFDTVLPLDSNDIADDFEPQIVRK